MIGTCSLHSGSLCQLKVDLGSFSKSRTLPSLNLEFNASKKLTIRRTKPIDERNDGDLLNESIYIDYRNSDKMKLFDGDHVIVREAAKNLSFVTSIGVLKKPGKYAFFVDVKFKKTDFFQKAVSSLKIMALEFKIIGQYLEHKN